MDSIAKKQIIVFLVCFIGASIVFSSLPSVFSVLGGRGEIDAVNDADTYRVPKKETGGGEFTTKSEVVEVEKQGKDIMVVPATVAPIGGKAEELLAGGSEEPEGAAGDDGVAVDGDGAEEAPTKGGFSRKSVLEKLRKGSQGMFDYQDPERSRKNPVWNLHEFIAGQPSDDIGNQSYASITSVAEEETRTIKSQGKNVNWKKNALGWYLDPSQDSEEKCHQPFDPLVKQYCQEGGNDADPTCSMRNKCIWQRKGLWAKPLTKERLKENYAKMLKKMENAVSSSSNGASSGGKNSGAESEQENTCSLGHFARRFVKTPKFMSTPNHVNKTNDMHSLLIPDEVDSEFYRPEFANGILKSIGHCSLAELDQADVLALLVKVSQGRPMLFVGDSMMRHIFSRLVMFLRGKTIVADRPYQCNAVYAVGEYGDFFQRETDAAQWDTVALGTSESKGGIGRRVLSLYFGWDRYMDRPRLPAIMRKSRPSTVVVGYFYWWNYKNPKEVEYTLKYLEAWLNMDTKERKLDRTQGENSKQPLLRRVILVSCPPLKKTPHYRILRQITLRNDLYQMWRTRQIYASWLTEQRRKERGMTLKPVHQNISWPARHIVERDAPRAKQILIVDYEALALWRRFPLVDLLHYQCSFVVRCLNPKTMNVSQAWSPIKQPCSKDMYRRAGVTAAVATHQDYVGCEDKMNMNNLRLLTHQLGLSVLKEATRSHFD